MNVLSLFDGMSCGQIALNRIGIKPDKYYASEIDKYAITVTQDNYPDTIQIGDVTKIISTDLPRIDLLLGGSPCQGFSFAGKELNFNDPRSVLFWEFVRILKELKPKYFLLENVVMKKEYQDIISKAVGCEPIKINSSLVTAQNRKRLYWTNVPNILPLTDKKVFISDLIKGDIKCGRVVGRRIKNGKRADYDLSIKPIQRFEMNEDNQKTNCLSTVQKDNVLIDSGTQRKLTINECEMLQTVPVGYTSSVSKTQSLRMLGNGWTVDIIAYILKEIRE